MAAARSGPSPSTPRPSSSPTATQARARRPAQAAWKVHTNEEGDWTGSVLWNDNHVGFEQTHLFETRYGSGSILVDTSSVGNDHLFEEDDDSDGGSGNDAFMVKAGNATISGTEN